MNESTPKSDRPWWKRILFYVAAAFFFVLGVLGAILPGLPATPFLLLTSYFLVRTSPRLNDLLLRSRFFGPILKDWQHNGGIRPDVKVQSMAIVFLVVAATLYFSSPSIWLGMAICGLAIVGIVVIFKLPTARPKEKAPIRNQGDSKG